MKIKSIVINRFRGYHEPVRVEIGDPPAHRCYTLSVGGVCRFSVSPVDELVRSASVECG